jgi:hypothetical protein
MSGSSKIYEKYARLYPVIVAMLIPLILFVIIGSTLTNTYLKLHHVWNVMISIIPASLITAAFGYGVKLVARSTSKLIFQYPLFKEDETQMPTTNYLLWSTNLASEQKKQLIREKIKLEIGLDLLDEQQERQNENEARLLIVDAVTQIRERTRDNAILFQYLCSFGFLRNFLGANVWALLITIIFMIINFWSQTVDIKTSIGAVLLVILLFPLFYIFLRQTSREYARQLFTSFMEI